MTITADAAASSDVSVLTRLTDETLRTVATHEDALSLLQNMGIVVEDFSADYGSGHEQIEKDALVNVPFIIEEFRFVTSDKVVEDGEFVVVLGITADDKKFLFVDGSTGIFEQLRNVRDARQRRGVEDWNKGLIVKKGLRVSDYEIVGSDGKKAKARTFYLAN